MKIPIELPKVYVTSVSQEVLSSYLLYSSVGNRYVYAKLELDKFQTTVSVVDFVYYIC